MRVGIGSDLHRLEPGGRLVLGGVEVDDRRGPIAHSDGDALLHAIIDAMLGAAGLGDIGDHFPDSDPQYRDADSRGLLRRAATALAEQGLHVRQIDATVRLERPKLGPHKAAMRANIAADLGLAPAMVNVKAKTNEGLGAVGRAEAVAAEAVVLLGSA
ncbi:MAG: 2-C-methyl-D-erythritol 2,4-cyclodiphosphate synthase [Planctomycetota bacterium]